MAVIFCAARSIWGSSASLLSYMGLFARCTFFTVRAWHKEHLFANPFCDSFARLTVNRAYYMIYIAEKTGNIFICFLL